MIKDGRNVHKACSKVFIQILSDWSVGLMYRFDFYKELEYQ